ncbi:hypothetical protein TFLX_00878 [Thermoflexales bacterium]|nr:hypothetical protein TFLX_00878 [Thermoflexales bacterium]
MPTNSFLQSLLNWLSTWFGRPGNSPVPGSRAVTLTVNNTTEPVQVLSPRVLVVVFDPVWDRQTGQRLSQAPETAHWNRVDDLLAGYLADVEECSGGLVKYQVVERITLDHFPVKEDQFVYDGASYLQALRTGRYHAPDWMDYGRVLNELRLLQRVEQGDCDEVWFFGAPGFGFYESRMAGRGAFWCNAPACENTESCHKRFVMMGFSYERGVGEMLEDLGHRAESILHYRWRTVPDRANLWKVFSRYDQVAPGQAEVGMMHWAPNSVRDYDWGNSRVVSTRADDWLNFPNLTGEIKTLNCSAWGKGDIRAHHKWWFTRLPKAPGRTNGVANQWWRYVIDVNNPELNAAGP